MRLAIVSPLPPQHTGIADYTSDLIWGLSQQGIIIELFSNALITLHHNTKVHNITKINDNILNEYDLIIYQLGNSSEHHAYMLDLMKRYPGIVHLHDVVMHHVFASNTYVIGDKNLYMQTIQKWYGDNTLDLISKMTDNRLIPWESEIVMEVPLFEEYIQYAEACIVHSDFSKDRIQKVFPMQMVYKVPQLYRSHDCMRVKKNTKKIVFGIFGAIDPQKKVDKVIEAFAKVFADDNSMDFTLRIVGGVNKKCDYIKKLPGQLNIEDKVDIIGRVDEQKFMEYFKGIDVLIALRYPTMGETSAVVMRAMQLGIPTMVNDIGWYSELPNHVIKIPIENMEKHLKNEVMNILRNDNTLIALSQEAIEYSQNNLNFDKYIDNYIEVLKKENRHKLNAPIYVKLYELFEEMEVDDDSIFMQTILNKTIDVF